MLIRRAQRVVLALARLTSNTAKPEELDSLRADVRFLADFHPEDFAAHLTKLRLSLTTP
ncbi:MAG: hypothetical protein M3Y03_01505 [Verrucomicrobiota bacterium]|nr:hypothetical protein [Verrucomicrobiota bacterium]